MIKELSKRDWILLSPCFLWAAFCLLMIAFYSFNPIDKQDFYGIKDIWDNYFYSLMWSYLGILSVVYLCFAVPYLKFDKQIKQYRIEKTEEPDYSSKTKRVS